MLQTSIAFPGGGKVVAVLLGPGINESVGKSLEACVQLTPISDLLSGFCFSALQISHLLNGRQATPGIVATGPTWDKKLSSPVTEFPV